MSVIIANISDELRARGVHRYVLRINHKVIAYFDHERGDGLAACLRRAAEAAEQPDRQEIKDARDHLDACVTALKESK